MAGFSGAVKLADLNDFIAPSQACVVSLEDLKQGTGLAQKSEDGSVSIQKRPGKGGWSQTIPTKSEADPVKISLQDCLACSGCVTSAETVLLEHQSTDELQSKLKDPDVSVVITLSRQSIASLAVAYQLTPQQVASKLATCLRGLGAKAVLDANTGRELALIEAAAEFLQTYRAEHLEGQSFYGAEDATLQERRHSELAASSSQPEAASRERGDASRPQKRRKPMLASACPGWVCYAEKTHGDYSLPHISSTKSPQAVMGSLVKRYWAEQHKIRAESIYHCTVMPCFDKKLEAARKDFDLPGTVMPETDAGLTTTELEKLLSEQHINLHQVQGEGLDTVFGESSSVLKGLPGGSGGYMEYIYRAAAKQLFGVEVPSGSLPLKAIRNTDLREATLEVDGKVVLRFALAYGFRNIQTVLRKVKQGLSQYDYVEVMACPSGCVNGGGQIPPPPGSSLQGHIQAVEEAYHHPEIKRQRPEDSPTSKRLYDTWVKDSPLSEQARSLLHTQYHKRDKSLAATIKDW